VATERLANAPVQQVFGNRRAGWAAMDGLRRSCGLYEADTSPQFAAVTVAGMHFEYCPEPGCRMPTEVLDRFTLVSTDGPLEHIAVRCVDRHQFLMPIELLPRAS
jgi:hypothetical protein